MQYNTIIFDWDGTIGMTLHLWLEGYRTGLENQGFSLPDREIMDRVFHEPLTATAIFPDLDSKQMFRDTRDFVHDNLPNLTLYAGAIETLESLHEKGTKMALVSSSERHLIEAALNPLGLRQFFSSIIAGNEVSARKPDPEAFVRTIKAIDADPQTTLIVGDSHVDIVAGKAAKTRTCLFTPEPNQLFYDFDTLRATDPDYNITTLTTLLPPV
ncbi:MAG: HAD-IA family hydrolase [Rhodobacteraceae bacterium]|nr:HAD-IA family hydrolase [Paracoccaceae bacterium]